jgi:hypothetical protein
VHPEGAGACTAGAVASADTQAVVHRPSAPARVQSDSDWLRRVARDATGTVSSLTSHCTDRTLTPAVRGNRATVRLEAGSGVTIRRQAGGGQRDG